MAVAPSTSQAACRQRGTAADAELDQYILVGIYWILVVHADNESGLDFPPHVYHQIPCLINGIMLGLSLSSRSLPAFSTSVQ